MSYRNPQIDIPEPSSEPPEGFYVELPDDSLECSNCGSVCADIDNYDIGLALGTCWRGHCLVAAALILKKRLAEAESSKSFPAESTK